MSILTLFQLFFAPLEGWRRIANKSYSPAKLFLLHVLPFSLVPAVAIYTAGRRGELLFLDLLSPVALLIVAIAFFIIQLISVLVMAGVIKKLANIAEVSPSFKQAYTLAAIAPTPLWMMPIFLLYPNMILILLMFSLAMMIAARFIYYGIPSTLAVFEEGHRIFLFGAILTAGTIAAGFLMVCTLVFWASLQGVSFS